MYKKQVYVYTLCPLIKFHSKLPNFRHFRSFIAWYFLFGCWAGGEFRMVGILSKFICTISQMQKSTVVSINFSQQQKTFRMCLLSVIVVFVMGVVLFSSSENLRIFECEFPFLHFLAMLHLKVLTWQDKETLQRNAEVWMPPNIIAFTIKASCVISQTYR